MDQEWGVYAWFFVGIIVDRAMLEAIVGFRPKVAPTTDF
jgi:hypothetical protein